MAFLRQLVTRNNPLESPAIPLSSLGNPSGWFLNWANGEPTSSGEHVTPFTALQVTTVVACVKLLSEGVGAMSIRIMENLERGQRVAYDHAYANMLAAEFNPEMTATVAMQVSLVHALLWGTSYLEVIRDEGNRPVELWPRKPWLTEPKRNRTGALVYECKDTSDGHARIIDAADMLCIPGLSLDGFIGQNTTQIARNTIGLALALERHSALFFGNGAVSAATVEVPNELSDKAYQRLKTSMDMQTTGSNKHRTVLLEGGAKWNQIASQNDQAQFLESKRLVRAEICSLMRVPGHMISDDSGRGVKSNTETLSNEFVTYSLAPWTVKYSQEINRKLFPKMGRTSGKYSVKFDTSSLLVADSAGRMAYYVSGRNAGILTANECRIAEGLEPVGPEGDVLMIPLNFEPAINMLNAPSDTGDNPLETDNLAGKDERNTKLLNKLCRAYTPILTDGFNRLSNRNKRDKTQITQCLTPSISTLATSFRLLLAQQSNVEIGDTECSRAIDKYLTGLEARTESIDTSAEVERVVKTIIHATYRDFASVQAVRTLGGGDGEDT
jgi:HK97 family phage portal protein